MKAWLKSDSSRKVVLWVAAAVGRGRSGRGGAGIFVEDGDVGGVCIIGNAGVQVVAVSMGAGIVPSAMSTRERNWETRLRGKGRA